MFRKILGIRGWTALLALLCLILTAPAGLEAQKRKKKPKPGQQVRNDTAATEYFKNSRTADLTAAFSPIVDRAMQRVGVVQQYNRLLATAPGASALRGQFDLNQYVVGKTLDGLFLMLGNEEKKIRKDPAAQTTAVLREVFGRR